LETLALRAHLHDFPHNLDLHPDYQVERLGVGDGRDLRDLAYLDTAKGEGRPDIQPLDGAIKEQHIGLLFGEKFAATEEQHPGDHADDGADHKGTNKSWTDLASHDVSFSLPAPGAGAGVTPPSVCPLLHA